MAQFKKAALREVHWNIPDWNEGDSANSMLRSRIGADYDCFAPVHADPRQYTWNLGDGIWTPLSAASPQARNEALRILSELRRRLEARLPEGVVTALLTVPNDDYVFVNSSPSAPLRVKLAGWGYSNYKRPVGGPAVVNRNDLPELTATISFDSHGEPVPGREFYITTPSGQKKLLHTDTAGLFTERGRAGEQRVITDALTGREFEIFWTEGSDNRYRCDVTEEEPAPIPEPEPEPEPAPILPPAPMLKVNVADSQGRPMGGAKISFIQNGNVYPGQLDATGSISLPIDTLTPGVAVRTSLATAQHTYPEIIWTPEADENEYLLQEVKKKETSVAAQVAVMFVALLISLLAGFVITSFSSGLYSGLYN